MPTVLVVDDEKQIAAIARGFTDPDRGLTGRVTAGEREEVGG